MSGFSHACVSITFWFLSRRLYDLSFLHTELSPNVQKHNDTDKAQTRNQHRRWAHLQTRWVIRVKLQDVISCSSRRAASITAGFFCSTWCCLNSLRERVNVKSPKWVRKVHNKYMPIRRDVHGLWVHDKRCGALQHFMWWSSKEQHEPFHYLLPIHTSRW